MASSTRPSDIMVQNFLEEMEFVGSFPPKSNQSALGGKEEDIPLLKNDSSSDDDDDDDVFLSNEECSDLQMENTRIFVDTVDRLTELVKTAPGFIFRLDAAAECLKMDKDGLLSVIRQLESWGIVMELVPHVFAWVVHGLTLEAREIQRKGQMQKAFEKAIRFVSDKTNGKRNWRWLYLTDADIKNFVVYQNDIFMAIKCPSEFNLEVPRPAQDGGYIGQRRYGMIYRCSEMEGMKGYYVSKLESRDVVEGENKRSRRCKGNVDADADAKAEKEGCKRSRIDADADA